MLDAEVALNAISTDGIDNEDQLSDVTQNNIEISVISSKETTNLNTTEDINRAEIIQPYLKTEKNHRSEAENHSLIMPIILVNDKPPEDLDQKWMNIVATVSNNEKFRGFHTRRKFKRKFCRSRRHAVFKRSYSIA